MFTRPGLVGRERMAFFPVEQHERSSSSCSDHGSWRRDRLATKVNGNEYTNTVMKELK